MWLQVPSPHVEDVNQYTRGAPPRPRLAHEGEENGDGIHTSQV